MTTTWYVLTFNMVDLVGLLLKRMNSLARLVFVENSIDMWVVKLLEGKRSLAKLVIVENPIDMWVVKRLEEMGSLTKVGIVESSTNKKWRVDCISVELDMKVEEEVAV